MAFWNLDTVNTDRARIWAYHEGIDALVADMKATPIPNDNRANASHRPGDRTFDGGVTLEEAYHLALYGWSEGRERLGKAMGLAKAHAIALPTTTTRHDVAGEQPDVGRYVSGMPDHMEITEESTDRRAPVVRMRVAINCPSQVPSASLASRGAAILAQIDAWEQSGIQIELIVCTDSNFSHGDEEFPEIGAPRARYHFRQDILVKRAGEPLELDRLAFVFMHPGFFRKVLFAGRDRLDGTKIMRKGYLQSIDLNHSDKIILNTYRKDGPLVYVPAVTPNTMDRYSSPAAAAAEIAKEFAHALTFEGMGF